MFKSAANFILALMVLMVLGTCAYLFSHLAHIPCNAERYLSELTLVVTIVSVFAALFSLAGIYITGRSVEVADKLRAATEEADRELGAKRLSSAKAEAETQAYLASLRNSAAAFHPSGLFLSQAMQSIGGRLVRQEAVPPEVPEPVRKWVAGLFDELSTAFLANAEFGTHVQQLFVGSDSEARSSALAILARGPRHFARSLIHERIEQEKKRGEAPGETSDVDLVAFLAGLLASFPAQPVM